MGGVCCVVACGGARGVPAPRATQTLRLAKSETSTSALRSAVPRAGTDADSPHYAVDAASLDRLLVRATLPSKLVGPLRVTDGAERFVSDARVRTSEGEWPLERDGQSFVTAHCADGCELSYAFGLSEAGRILGDAELAESFPSAVLAPSSTWLLGSPAYAGYSLEVRPRAPEVFLTAFPPRDPARAAGTVVSTSATIFAPFAAFGAWRTRVLAVSEARVTVGITGGPYAISDDELTHWVEQTLTPMAEYYRGLPRLYPLILVVPGNRGIHGVTLGNGGSSVLLRVGREVTSAVALDGWVPTHELVHVLFPSVAPRLPWVEEGLATYVEPIIRARAGRVTVRGFWTDLLEGLPQGLPQKGDRGLDHTPTWGRTYWGGALYWLLTDVRIRERTQNHRSVQDALVAILHAGGDVSVDWSLERILGVADAACGGREFRDTYAEMGPSPGSPNLQQLLAELGVSFKNRSVVFDEAARLASVRAGITAATPLR